MDELDKVIEPSEHVLWRGKPQYAPYMIPSVLGAIVFVIIATIFVVFAENVPAIVILPVVLLALLSILIAHLKFNATHYGITNKRVIFQKGIIGRDFVSIDYDRMQNVSVNVGIVGAIFKVGDVRIFTGKMATRTRHSRHGRTSSYTVPVYDTLASVDQPYDVLKKMQNYLSYRKESMYGGYGHPAGKANRHHTGQHPQHQPPKQ